jgi:hypothetical protein
VDESSDKHDSNNSAKKKAKMEMFMKTRKKLRAIYDKERPLKNFKYRARTQISADEKIESCWYLEETGLALFFKDYFHYFVDIEKLKGIISNPPSDSASRKNQLSDIVLHIDPPECTGTEPLIADSYSKLRDHISHPCPDCEEGNCKEVREAFREFIGANRDRFVIDLAEALPTNTAVGRKEDKSKKWWMTYDHSKLPPQKQYLSQYFVGLTPAQREILSLRLEYGLSVNKISHLIGRDRKTIDEHLKAATKKMEYLEQKLLNKKSGAKPSFHHQNES